MTNTPKFSSFGMPIFYRATHYGLGFVAAFYSPIVPVFVGYQLFQLSINRRFFVLSMELRKPNTLMHTGVKLSEFIIGVAIANQFNKFLLK
tara:strand:- start:3860 stop:4132 length:273 start_codon:yes stop_codon:yes gene_type:complete